MLLVYLCYALRSTSPQIDHLELKETGDIAEVKQLFQQVNVRVGKVYDESSGNGTANGVRSCNDCDDCQVAKPAVAGNVVAATGDKGGSMSSNVSAIASLMCDFYPQKPSVILMGHCTTIASS